MKRSKWTGPERNAMRRKNTKAVLEAMGAKARRAAREESKQELYDLGLLMSKTRADGECRIWAGRWLAFGESLKPILKGDGELHGYVYADNAILEIKLGRKLDHKCFPARTCGRYDCVAYEHLYESSVALERARRAHGHEGFPAEHGAADCGMGSKSEVGRRAGSCPDSDRSRSDGIERCGGEDPEAAG